MKSEVSKDTHGTKKEALSFDEGLESLRRLRDEIRLELHLASMEAKDTWKKLEPRLGELERAARTTTQASRAAVNTLLHELAVLRDQLKVSRPH
jgi:hypothetical protein